MDAPPRVSCSAGALDSHEQIRQPQGLRLFGESKKKSSHQFVEALENR
jgi:hypothetical protein